MFLTCHDISYIVEPVSKYTTNWCHDKRRNLKWRTDSDVGGAGKMLTDAAIPKYDGLKPCTKASFHPFWGFVRNEKGTFICWLRE